MFQDLFLLGAVLALLAYVVYVMATRKRRRGRVWPGPGTAGAMYDLLSQDRRNAIEMIVEGRAEESQPERAGDQPDSPHPGGAPPEVPS